MTRLVLISSLKQGNNGRAIHLPRGPFADVAIVAQDNTEVPAHRAILSMASPTLKRCLKSANAILILPDYRATSIRQVLSLLYTGKTTGKLEDYTLVSDLLRSLDIKLQTTFSTILAGEACKVESGDSDNPNDLSCPLCPDHLNVHFELEDDLTRHLREHTGERNDDFLRYTASKVVKAEEKVPVKPEGTGWIKEEVIVKYECANCLKIFYDKGESNLHRCDGAARRMSKDDAEDEIDLDPMTSEPGDGVDTVENEGEEKALERKKDKKRKRSRLDDGAIMDPSTEVQDRLSKARDIHDAKAKTLSSEGEGIPVVKKSKRRRQLERAKDEEESCVICLGRDKKPQSGKNLMGKSIDFANRYLESAFHYALCYFDTERFFSCIPPGKKNTDEHGKPIDSMGKTMSYTCILCDKERDVGYKAFFVHMAVMHGKLADIMALDSQRPGIEQIMKCYQRATTEAKMLQQSDKDKLFRCRMKPCDFASKDLAKVKEHYALNHFKNHFTKSRSRKGKARVPLQHDNRRGLPCLLCHPSKKKTGEDGKQAVRLFGTTEDMIVHYAVVHDRLLKAMKKRQCESAVATAMQDLYGK